MARVAQFDGKELFFPDYYTDEQILDKIDEIREREARGLINEDYGASLRRGFAKGLPGIARLGAGAVGFAGDVADLLPGVEGTFDSPEAGIRDFADDITQRIGGEAVQDVSDTFWEKVAEGAGKAPGIALEFAPTMAIPVAKAGQVGASAIRFGAHGALAEGGHGLGASAGGALKGAAEGALFGALGEATAGIPSAIGRKLAHAGTTAGAITGIGAAYGAPLEDALAEGLGMASFGLVHPSRNRAELTKEELAYRTVGARAKELMAGNRGLTEREAIDIAAKEYKQADLEGFVPAEGSIYHADPTLEHRQKRNKWEEGEIVEKEPLPPLDPRIEKMQDSFNNFRIGEVVKAVQETPKEAFEAWIDKDPMTFKKHVQEYEALNPKQRSVLRELYGREVTEHDFVKMQYLGKELISETAVTIQKGKEALQAANATGDPIKIQAAENWLSESRREFEQHVADFVGLGREWKHAGKARAAVVSKMEPGEKALLAVERSGKLAKLPENIIDKIIEDPSNWRAAHEAVRAAMNPRTIDHVYEAWINGLLSGPPTHVVNATSNTVTQVLSTVERGIAPFFDWGRHALDPSMPRERYAAELFGDLIGWKQGIKAALPEAIRAMHDESYKQEVPSAIETPLYSIPNKAGGKAIRLPSRLLRASDLLFKAIASQREGWAQAYRIATKEGLTGEKRAARAKEIMESPSEVIIERMGRATKKGEAPEKIGETTLDAEMEKYAQIQTFTNKLGETGQLFTKMRDKTGFLKWVVPFVRTPANIIKYGIKRTPLGLIDSGRKWAAYKRGELEPGVVADSAAASMLGMTLTAAVVQMAEDGFITGGGPTDWNEQLNKRQTGWQPYSIRNPFGVGRDDQWISYSRIEPLATVMGMAADYFEAQSADELEADKIMAAIKDNLTNKTFLVGLENLAKAWADPDMFAKAYFKTMVGSAVPNIIAQGANVSDPFSRYTDAFGTTGGIPDVWAKRIPGMSEKLPVRYTTTGEKIVKPERVGSAMLGNAAAGLSPFAVTTIDPTRKLEMEMDSLSGYENVPPSAPKRARSIPVGPGQKRRVELTDGEYEVLMDYRRRASDVLRRLVAQEGWDDRTPYQKARVISKVYRKFDQAAGNKVNMMLKRRLSSVDAAY